MSYDVRPLNAPRLAGAALRLFAAAVETPFMGAPLRRAMLKAAEIPEFRRFVVDEGSIVVPPLPASGEAPATSELRHNPEGSAFTAAYRSGSSIPAEVAERFLDAVAAGDRSDPPLRAFIAVNSADLLAQARESTQRYREGRRLGPLDGVPVAVKDELDQVPYPTTAGTSFLSRQPARTDATAVGWSSSILAGR